MGIKLSGKNSPIGREKRSGKRIQRESFFPMEKCLILTGSITVKIVVYGLLIGRKQIGEVEKKQRKFPQKVMVWLAICSEGIASLVRFEKGTVDHHRYIKEVLPVALPYGNSKFGKNWTFQQDNGTSHTHQETQDWRSQRFPSFLDKDTWPANSRDLNPLDYCIWDKFAQTINWSQVTWKSSLISELTRGVKKVCLDVVRESCSVWTNRLYPMTQNDGYYLREYKAACLVENRKMNLFKKRVLRLIKVFTRYCESRKKIIYSETLSIFSIFPDE